VTAAVGVLGVGLIGGSIGLCSRRNGARVVGYDCDPPALESALAAGAIDAVADAPELYARADVVVIAMHLEATLRELERLARNPRGQGSALILDVSSVKVPVMTAAAGIGSFVGTHPMAGSERAGVLAARADLFQGAAWAYVPTGRESLDAQACDFIRSCGANALAVDAADHDRIVALTSHVPAILASRYGDLYQGEGDARQLCGPVARELLRIGELNPAMWRPILRANGRNVAPHLRRLARELEAAAETLS